ncbi:AN1-type zinc finger protein 6 [Orchesella cincta]|uniref:AN1-type zinc finger protein 6 n=1 Tax=Orchesella cincta TaxID=48709 RepID=A0A1D2M9F4_ORCCI|nr:AN1-type zinc finger protein 6 [Orchesella cincta]
MEGESNGMEGNSSQCRAGCGYFGNAATDGLCSVCYKEVVKKKQQPPTGSLIPAPQRTASSCEARTTPPQSQPQIKLDAKDEDKVNAVCAVEAADPVTEMSAESESKKKKNRCQSCNKKVGLTGFECRCGGMYCAIHRYSDKHDCKFDYRQLGAEQIRKNNPVIAAAKISKI